MLMDLNTAENRSPAKGLALLEGVPVLAPRNRRNSKLDAPGGLTMLVWSRRMRYLIQTFQ